MPSFSLKRIPVLWGRTQNGGTNKKQLMIRGGAVAVVIGICYMLLTWFTLPDITDPVQLLASQSTVITDRNGVELYRLFNEEDRTFIPGSSIPQHMKHAVVAIEDKRYYERGCVDMRAVARVVIKLGRAGGGSTITRQLARNALNLQQDNRYQRKVKEFILGCQLESQYEKEELLDLYLNWIPFGQNAYGVEQAAKRYFNTSAENLSIAQATVLASLPQRPSYFSPYGRHVYTEVSESVHDAVIDGTITKTSEIPEEDITIGLLGAYAGTGSTVLYVGGRTDQVLQNMKENEFITDAERLTLGRWIKKGQSLIVGTSALGDSYLDPNVKREENIEKKSKDYVAFDHQVAEELPHLLGRFRWDLEKYYRDRYGPYLPQD